MAVREIWGVVLEEIGAYRVAGLVFCALISRGGWVCFWILNLSCLLRWFGLWLATLSVGFVHCVQHIAILFI
jgi:ABC-type sulfate transport system permease component